MYARLTSCSGVPYTTACGSGDERRAEDIVRAVVFLDDNHRPNKLG
jgi:hypothetical protein